MGKRPKWELARPAPTSNEDIARVAAAVSMDPAPGQSYRPTGPELLSTGYGEGDRPSDWQIGSRWPTPIWLFMKTARMAACKIELMSNVHCKVDDHRRDVFELDAPTTDVPGVCSESIEIIILACQFVRQNHIYGRLFVVLI